MNSDGDPETYNEHVRAAHDRLASATRRDLTGEQLIAYCVAAVAHAVLALGVSVREGRE